VADCRRDLVQLASKDRRPAKWSHHLKVASRGLLQGLRVVRPPQVFRGLLRVAFKDPLKVAFKALLQVTFKDLLQVTFKGLRPDLEQNLQQGQQAWKWRLRGTARS
jgi:hypothetical protein